MYKIAFYVMNSKGYFVVKNFIEKFGNVSIDYIVCSEDKNIKKDFFNEIKTLAIKSNINFFHRTDDYIKLENEFTGYKLAIGWRWLIKNDTHLIVFHDSLLPKYRGFAPLVNYLANNEKMGGVTALFASSEYDKGDIIAQKSFVIQYPIKINDAIKQIEPLYFELVDEIFLKIKSNISLKSYPQNEDQATYSLWLDSQDYFIDWSWSAEEIKRFIDAVGYPYDYAKAYLKNDIVTFIEVTIVEDVTIENRSRHIGKVIFIKDDAPVVICKNGLIKLNEIRDSKDKKLFINFRSRFT